MKPVRFIFGLHLHQPWGNFDHVVAEHVEEVYRPLLAFVEKRELTPIALHVSGPLLEWLEAHDRDLHETIGRMADEGRAELLTAGFYEPILAALTRADRGDQLGWMREYLDRRFGVRPRTAWLTERVFESELVQDLADAGVENLLVDDWHLMAGGLPREALYGHYVTEGDGRALNLVPIHERLRYLVPFQAADRIRDYFLQAGERGQALAVLGDDGEKFGGWPGTKQRVWVDGWIEEFADVLTELRDGGTIELTSVESAVGTLPSSGLAYLPTSSYREMGEWALPPELVDGADHPFPAAHWKNFLVRYEEANRLHKKALALSRLCRERGDPPEPRTAIGRAQCNDPYWHGIFGGIYMKHLRDAAWSQLGAAEAALRAGEGLSVEHLDLDFDGDEELWIHNRSFSAQVGRRSGRVKELTHFASGFNYADVLTRRWEAYHGAALERGALVTGGGGSGPDGADAGSNEATAASIHTLEESYVLYEAPLIDTETRTLLMEMVVPGDVTPEAWETRDFRPLWSWTPGTFGGCRSDEHGVTLTFSAGPVERELTFSERGDVTVSYRWEPDAFPEDALFAVEVSAGHPLEVVAHPPGREWTYEIVTVPRAERGFERITQGTSTSVLWPASRSEARIELRAGGQ